MRKKLFIFLQMLMVILATVGCRNAFGAEAGYSYEVIPLEITAADISCDRSAVENLTVQDVKLTKKDGIEFPDSVTMI